TAMAPATINGGAVRTTGDQAWDGTVSVGADTTFDAGGGVAFAQPLAVPGRAVTVTAGATVTFAGAVSAGSVGVTGGPIQVNGGGVTTTGGQSYAGMVTLGADATFSATAGGAITFDGSVSGAGRSLTVSTGGTATLGGPVSVGSLDMSGGGPIQVNGGGITTTGDQSYAGPVTLGADATLTASGAVAFAAAVDGPGGLTVKAAGLTFGGPVGGATRLGFLTADAPATINGGDVRTTGDQAWDGAVLLGADTTFDAGGKAAFAQSVSAASRAVTVTAVGAATFGGPVTAGSVAVTGGPIQLNGGSVTTTGGQSYSGAVTLGANTTLSDATGGAVTFGGSVTGAGQSLTVAITGTATFVGPVSVGSLAVTGGGRTRINGGSVTTGGGQSYAGPVALGADTTLTAGGGVTFVAAVDGPGGLSVTASGLTFGGPIGGGTRLGFLTANAPAAVNGGRVATTGSQTWNASVTVGADVIFAANGGVGFAKQLSGSGRAVTVAAGGPVAFGGPVSVGALTVTAPQIQVAGGSVSTTAGEQFNGPVAIANDTTFAAGGPIAFASSLDGVAPGGQAIAFTAGGDITVGGAVGGTAAPRAVTVTTAASVTLAAVRTGVFNQQAGTGTTTFGGPAEIAGDLGVVTGGVRLLADVTTGGDATFQTGSSGVTQTGGGLSTGNLALAGVGPFALDQPGNSLTGTFRAAVTAGSVSLAVQDSLTIDPVAGVQSANGDLIIRTGGDFTLVDPRPAGAGQYSSPLINLGSGSFTLYPGLARGAAVTLDAEVVAAVAALGVAGGGNNGADLFTVRPSAFTPITIAGNLPASPLPAAAVGDRLAVRFTGATVTQFRFDGQDGAYGFADRQPLTFTGIESLPGYGISGFVVQTGEPNDATGAVQQQYAVRLVRTQDGVPLGGGLDGAGLAQNAFVVSPSRIAAGTPLGPPRLAFADVNGDGVADLILANGPGAPPLVTIVDGRQLDAAADGTLARLDSLPASAILAQFYAYEPTFLGGVNVSAGDLNGDGRAEVMTAADNGGGPHVRTFTFVPGGAGLTAVQYPGFFGSFFAYEPSFRGGARVAVADVTGDGTPDLVIGTGVGGGPRVLVYDGRTGQLVRSFFAYESTFRGGVYVDAGDYDGDGFADILTAPGDGGASHIEVF
ncbi:MAG TPA: FG-GAP-like repeat-containing protein, partial [Urbifossiella sp.]|nr:FG-GAP-like repeat-containing protein [Urbifossiella sp.]